MKTRSVHSASIALVAIFVTFFVAPKQSAAQGAVQAEPNPGGVFVAVLDAFPDLDARALVVRERGRAIVVLRAEETSVDVLAMSLVVVDRMNRRELAPGQAAMAPISGFVVDRLPSGEERRRLEGALRRLEDAPDAEIGTLGPGRWVRLR